MFFMSCDPAKNLTTSSIHRSVSKVYVNGKDISHSLDRSGTPTIGGGWKSSASSTSSPVPSNEDNGDLG